MPKDKNITVLNEFRPLTDEELSVELTPDTFTDTTWDEEVADELVPDVPNDVSYDEEVSNELTDTTVDDANNDEVTNDWIPEALNDITINEDVNEDVSSVELAEGLNNATPDEEFAAELAPRANNVIPINRARDERTDEEESTRSGWAITGVIASVLSLFFLPYILAPVGIILGYIGYREGDRSLGIWAMGLGAIGLLGTLIVAAFI